MNKFYFKNKILNGFVYYILVKTMYEIKLFILNIYYSIKYIIDYIFNLIHSYA